MTISKSSSEIIDYFLKHDSQIIGFGKSYKRQLYPDVYLIRKFENLFQTQKVKPNGTILPDDINFFKTREQAVAYARADAIFFEKRV